MKNLRFQSLVVLRTRCRPARKPHRRGPKACREAFAVQKEVRMIFSRVFGFESWFECGWGIGHGEDEEERSKRKEERRADGLVLGVGYERIASILKINYKQLSSGMSDQAVGGLQRFVSLK
jgi:hypothetical protein